MNDIRGAYIIRVRDQPYRLNVNILMLYEAKSSNFVQQSAVVFTIEAWAKPLKLC